MNIKQAIELISIKDLVESTGRMPVSGNTATGEYCYQAPYREDSKPSFQVNVFKKRFYDQGRDGLRGDVVQLARLIMGNGDDNAVTVSEALAWLKQFSGGVVAPDRVEASQRPRNSAREVSHTGEVYKLIKPYPITTKSNAKNVAYITEDRGISLPLAMRYLNIIAYQDLKAPATDYLKGIRYGIGMQNDAGGYEVRAPSTTNDFKTSLGNKDVTSINSRQPSTRIHVFEGQFDFLTWLELHNAVEPPEPVIILNTSRFTARAVELIKGRANWQHIKTVINWQHNDGEGPKVTQKLCDGLEEAGYTVGTMHHLYDGYKDLNKWWTHTPIGPERSASIAQITSSVQLTQKSYDTSASAEARRTYDERLKQSAPKL